MEVAIIVSVVTGIGGIAASIVALIGTFRKTSVDDSASRRVELARQAAEIQDGMKDMLAMQEHYYKIRIEDLEADLKEAKERITQLEKERGNHAKNA